DGAQRLLLAGTGDRVRDRAAHPGELDQGRADTARGTGDQDVLALGEAGAVEHLLGGEAGAAERGQARIGDVGGDLVGVGGRDRDVLGVAAVAAVADVVDVGEGLVAFGAVVEAEVDHHPLPDPVPAHAAADGDDAADDVRALDAREAEGGATAPPGGDLRGIGLAAVGALAHPDVGVVHAAGVDVDEHLP